MKFIRNLFNVFNNDLFGEVGIKGHEPGPFVQTTTRFKISHLSIGVNSGIGSPGPNRLDFFLCNLKKGVF